MRSLPHCIVACAAALLVIATAAEAAPVARLKLESYRKGVAARIVIGGKPRLLQLDTAGGVTVIAPTLAKELDCHPWGAVTGFHMTGGKITGPRCDKIVMRWGNTTLVSPIAAVLDVGSSDSPIDGLLALDAFAGKTITIDFARRELTIESPASASRRTRGAIELRAHLQREIGGIALSVFVEAPTANGPLRLELDSGNGGTILVGRPYAALLGLTNTGDAPRMGKFRIAPGVEASGLIFSPDLIIDGNLGMPFLKDWIVTMDLTAGRVWLRRNGLPPPAGMGTAPPLATP